MYWLKKSVFIDLVEHIEHFWLGYMLTGQKEMVIFHDTSFHWTIITCFIGIVPSHSYQIFIGLYDFPIFIEFLGCIEHSDSGLHADRAKGAGDFFMAQFLFWPKPARAWVAQWVR